MWKGVLYLKKKGSVVWGVSFFSENKQCVLLPSLLRKADTASVPDLVLRNSSYHTNGKSLKRQLPQLCVLPGPFPWQGVGVSCVLWCVWFLSVLWTVREEDSTTDRPCSVPFGDRDPPAGRTRQHQSSQGAPAWPREATLGTDRAAQCWALCRRKLPWGVGWELEDVSELWRLFWALCPQCAFYLGSCSYFSSFFVASLQELRGHLLQHVLQQWTCTAIVS